VNTNTYWSSSVFPKSKLMTIQIVQAEHSMRESYRYLCAHVLCNIATVKCAWGSLIGRGRH